MRVVCRVIAIMLFVFVSRVYADERLPSQKEFEPPNGKGRVVVVVSGHLGPGAEAYYAKDIAGQGYYTVLVNGNDFWKKGVGGGALLKGVITRAQQSPHALPGKAAVIGFSLGGASSLTYATRMPALVSAVVTYYSETSFITDPGAFVSKVKVPTLMFAGVLDTYKNCCLIETARRLADAAKASKVTLRVIEYPDAPHGWAIKYSKDWRGNDAADAFSRTLDHLRQNSGN
jgi:dipeptidyl aminopeptidase/acylaminoacyl peptidase